MGGPSSHKKHLDIFFKILSQRCLAACFGDLFATQSSCENRVFCIMRVFFRTGFKNFSFSLASCDYSSFCQHFPPSKSLCSHINSPYSSSLLHQTLRKGMDFVSFSIYFTFLFLDFLYWVFWWFMWIWCLNMGICCFDVIVLWVLLVMCFYTLSLVAHCVICSTNTFSDMIETLISWF